MSPGGTAGSGPHGDLTAPAGSFVTSWALRNYIENNAGYGWTFESAANTTTPAVKFEIRSSDGLFHAYGNGIIDGSVGIGTAAPGAKLEVAGQVKITGGSPGAGKVLTSDALGLATWVAPTVGTVTGVTGTAPIVSSGGTAPVISITLASSTTNGYLSSANWNTFNNKVNGSGTLNYVSKWTNATTQGNSLIFDNGTNVGVGTAAPGFKLHVPSGYIGTDYINTVDNGFTGTAHTVTGIIIKAGDNYHRTADAASVRTFLGITAPTGDNLGNHTATTTLAMAANQISNTTFVNMTAGNGNGIRFWGDDNYKIHMGNAAEYKYGPVTDYSIKMNMNSQTGRGWTWGVNGVVPVAALECLTGTMQIKGDFKFGNYLYGNGKYAIDATDSWLRLNQQGSFTNGIYSPGFLRVDGGFASGGLASAGAGTITTTGFVNSSTGYRVSNAAPSGNYLRGNGTNFVASGILAGDVPTLNQNTTGYSASAYYLRSPYPYNINISDATTAITLCEPNSLTSVNMHSAHGLFGSWATTLTMSGYERYGAYQISGNYNSAVPELAIRNYVQSSSTWNSWVKLITTANIGSQGFIPNNGSGDWQIASNSNATGYSTSSLELRETNFAGAGQQPPRLGFHWGGVVASQIAIENSGRISIRNNPGTGYENLIAKDIYADGGWFRAIGNQGLYFESYGGGWYMQDATWIRGYNGKSLWMAGGLIGGDGGLTVGYGGASSPGGGAIIAGKVGVGTSAPAASAALDITSTSQGFLPPRMNTSQRTAIVSPVAGLVVYNTSINCLEFYNGSAWVSVCGTGGGCSSINNGAGGTYNGTGLANNSAHAKAACESVYGVGGCTTGGCGNFSYWYQASSLSCNCGKAVGSYEWIYSNSGYTQVGQDYGGQTTSVSGDQYFVRQKGSGTCDGNSWILTLKTIGDGCPGVSP